MCRLTQWKSGQCLADIKYKYIENIAREAEKCRNINRIMLFGSQKMDIFEDINKGIEIYRRAAV